MSEFSVQMQHEAPSRSSVITQAADQFTRQIVSISEINRTVLPELEAQAEGRQARLLDEAQRFVPPSEIPEYVRALRELSQGILSVVDGGEGKKESFTMKVASSPGAALMHFVTLGLEQMRSAPHHELLRNSLLVSSVSAFEVLFGRIARAVFDVNKAALNESDHGFTLQQLAEFSSLGDAREFLIERQISKLLYESPDGWEKWLKRAAGGTSMVALPIDWIKIREAFARRNLLVHADGVVNRLYLDTIGKLGAPKYVVPLGDRLHVSSEYLDEHLQSILALGRLLSTDVGMKLHKRERDSYLRLLMTEVDRALHKEMWLTCISLSQYCLTCELTRGGEIDARTWGWVARKEQFGLESIRGEVEEWDVSGLAPEFALRKALLLGGESSIGQVRKLLKEGKVTFLDVAKNPLYKELREQLQHDSGGNGPEGEENPPEGDQKS